MSPEGSESRTEPPDPTDSNRQHQRSGLDWYLEVG